jgi:hypothetical protein
MLQTAVKLNIRFNDPDQDAEEREAEAQSLMRQLRDLDEVESVGSFAVAQGNRVLDPAPLKAIKLLARS